MALLGGDSTASLSALYTAGTTAAISVASTGGQNGLLVIDCRRPPTRYLQITLTNATTLDCQYGGVLARPYNARSLPVSASTTGELLGAKVFVDQPSTASA